MFSTTEKIRGVLHELGLSKLEVRLYLYLVDHPGISVSELAEALHLLPPSVHRSLKKLRDYRMVYTHGKRPLVLYAHEPQLAMSNLVQQRHRKQLELIRMHTTLSAEPDLNQELEVQFLEDIASAYVAASQLVKSANEELRILSVGESIPEELFLAYKRALERGVVLRFLAQKYTAANKEMLHNWIKNGWCIRHLDELQTSFSMVVFDAQAVLLQIRKPGNLRKRLGVILYNPYFAITQANFFDNLWVQGKKL